MKIFQTRNWLLIIAATTIFAACKKDDAPPPVIGFNSFKVLAKDNPGLVTDITGVMSGESIVMKLPASADVTRLIPSYELANPQTIVYVQDKARENGVDSVDFTEPVVYRLKTREAVKEYKITAVKAASFIKFRFLSAENPDLVLMKDYSGVVKGLNIKVDVPVGTDLSKVKANFETSPGATVKAGGVVQQSGAMEQDYTSPVIFDVSDAESSSQYTVTVGYLAPEWQKIADQATVAEAIVIGSLKVAVNPTSNYPAIVYSLSKDASGTTLDGAFKKASVRAYDGTGWISMGDPLGVSTGEARDPQIAYDKTGALYLAYKDYADELSANQQRMTVKKFNNNAWTTLGAERFSPTKAEYISLTTDADNNPWISLGKSDAAADPVNGFERRQLYTMKYEGSAWQLIKTPNKVLAPGTKLITSNDKMYMGVIDRTLGTQRLSAFEYTNGSWTGIGPSSFAANDKVASTQVSIAVAPDGTSYMAYLNASVSSAKVEYVMKYNGTTWEVYGDETQVGTSDEKFALAVHPNGTVFFAYALNNEVMVKSFNRNTNNWNAPVSVIKAGVSGIDMTISSTGIVYLAAGISSTAKIEVYKLDTQN